MIRFILLLALALPGLADPAGAQDSGRSLISAARKRLAQARGTKGEERQAILEDALRILGMVPERFPEEKPAVARAALESGRLFARLGRADEARASLERVLAFTAEERTVCNALHELATLHRKARRMEDAQAALQRIVEDHPGQPRARARALIRMAGIRRGARDLAGAEELLRRCLKEHGDLWRQAIDALDALVALKIRAKDLEEARRVLEAQGEAIRARFAGTRYERSVASALERMKSRGRLEKSAAGKPPAGSTGG